MIAYDLKMDRYELWLMPFPRSYIIGTIYVRKCKISQGILRVIKSMAQNLWVKMKILNPGSHDISQKLRQTKCIIFTIWRLKCTIIPKKYFALGNLAKLVFWSILSFKNWKINTWFVSVSEICHDATQNLGFWFQYRKCAPKYVPCGGIHTSIIAIHNKHSYGCRKLPKAGWATSTHHLELLE